MEQQYEEDRNTDNQLDAQRYSLLERAIRLLRKNTHYEFYDDIRGFLQGNRVFLFPCQCRIPINISYGEYAQSVPPKNQHMLKAFWRCLTTRFFKQIEDFDVEVLKYYKLLLSAPIQDTHLPYFSPEAYLAITSTLCKPIICHHEALLNYENLIHYIFLEFLCIQTTSSDKKTSNRLKYLRREKHNLIPRLKSKPQRSQMLELYKQRQQLQEMIKDCPFSPYCSEQDEISRQIADLEAELQEINASNKAQLEKLAVKVDDEIMLKTPVYVINSNHDKQHAQTSRLNLLEEKQLYLSNASGRLSLLLRYLSSSVLELEYKQVAESVSKICPKAKSTEIFDLTFEKGLGIAPSSANIKDLRALEKSRELSMLKYYNTSMKTKHCSISHLVSGFQMLLKRKSIQSLRNKDLLKQAKESKQHRQLNIITEETKKAFQSFDICHHCKQLYDSSYLVKCTYHSSTMGPPSQNLSFIDPYIQQILERQTLTTPRQFVNNQRNPYMGYHKKGTQYVCQRRYCKFCLKHSYGQIQKNGTCAFCQGVCFCSRCLRNDTIIKLKTMYSLMGGDVTVLNQSSLLYKLAAPNAKVSISSFHEQLVNTHNNGKSPSTASQLSQTSKKNSPKPIHRSNENPKATARQFLKLQDIRQQVCQLVKRREKQKLFIVQNRQQIFVHMVNDLDVEFKVGKRPRAGEGPGEAEGGRKCRKLK